MPLYNAVLLPSADFSERATSYAQDKYASIADGYCLSEKAYPHITLAQFKSDDQPMIFIDATFEPQFTNFEIRQGTGEHHGYSWARWMVQKEQWLIELQKTVCSALESENAEILSEQDKSYDPHMTFCRVPKDKENEVDPALIEQSQQPWIFTIGSSDQNGQFLG